MGEKLAYRPPQNKREKVCGYSLHFDNPLVERCDRLNPPALADHHCPFDDDQKRRDRDGEMVSPVSGDRLTQQNTPRLKRVATQHFSNHLVEVLVSIRLMQRDEALLDGCWRPGVKDAVRLGRV